MKKYILIATNLLLAVFIYCGSYYGGGVNAWFSNPGTAREIGMGMTGVSNAKGASSFLWNPARLDSLDLAITISDFANSEDLFWSQQKSNETYSGHLSTVYRDWGFNLRYKQINHIGYTNYDPLTSTIIVDRWENSYDWSANINYSHSFNSSIAVGCNLRSSYNEIFESSYTIGSDVGGLVRFPYSFSAKDIYRFQYGIVLSLDSEIGNENPVYQYSLASGLSYIISDNWSVSTDFKTGNYQSNSISLGSEYSLWDQLYLRIGLSNYFSSKFPNEVLRTPTKPFEGSTYGIGFKIKKFMLDVSHVVQSSNYYYYYTQSTTFLSFSYSR